MNDQKTNMPLPLEGSADHETHQHSKPPQGGMGKRVAGHPRTYDLSGMQFGRLRVERFVGINIHGVAQWECVCECGNIKVTYGGNLRSGHTQSCGCFNKERIREALVTHGESPAHKPSSKEYRTWASMKRRTSNPKTIGFKNYGGRGIKVCERWFNSYENFLADMGRCPEGCSIDRINNDGNYEPGNCRWATIFQQQANTRISKRVEYMGKTQCLSEWARETGIPVGTISQRLIDGFPLEKVFSKTKLAKYSHPKYL